MRQLNGPSSWAMRPICCRDPITAHLLGGHGVYQHPGPMGGRPGGGQQYGFEVLNHVMDACR